MNENQKKLIEDRGSIISETFKNLNYTNETLEEYFSHYVQTKNTDYPITLKNYEPVMYKIVKDPKKMRDRESLVDIQRGFIRRSEKLLKAYKHRATLTDGLKGLSDREILQKVRDAPTRIKRNTKGLVKRLDKMNVTLNSDGTVDYSQVPYKHVVKSLQKIDGLVRIALMQRDLAFEYPQHAEKMKIKGDILKIVNAEEIKLKQLQYEKEVQEKADPILSYEQYFESLISDQVRDVNESRQRQRELAKSNETELIFEKDLEERAQLFLEDDFEREKRLRETWIDLKKKNIIGGPDARTPNEQIALQELIVDKIRDLRWKIDQEMVKQHLDPLFRKAYSKYTKDEFMFDADIQFSKLKHFLEKNPRILKEDLVVGQEYMGIINLIRRKKLLEYTTPAYAKEHEEDYDSMIESAQVILYFKDFYLNGV